MKSTISSLVVLLLILFLSACGQSGPLYVPGDPSSIQPPAEQPDEEEKKDKDEDEDEDSERQ
jgi:predicted small lipoprotein YifL